MNKRLAHQTQPLIANRDIFAWDRADLTHFRFVSSKGWTTRLVDDNGLKYLEIKAPASWVGSAGEAYFVLAGQLGSGAYQVDIVHTGLTGGGSFGPVMRFADMENHISLRWRPEIDVSSVWYRNAGEDSRLAACRSNWSGGLIRSVGWCADRLYGGGMGCIEAISEQVPATLKAHASRTPGFGVFSLVGASGGGETIKIYDFVVRPR